MTLRAFLFFACVFAASPTLQGQVPARFEINPYFGYLFGGTAAFFSSPPVEGESEGPVFRYNLAGHTTYGIRAGYNLGSHVEPELQWSHTSTGLRRSGRLTPGDICLQTDCLTLDTYLGGLTYNFGAGRARPYVTLSAGATQLWPTYSLSDPEAHGTVRFTGAVGAGAKVFFTRAIGLRLDAHAYATRTAGISYGGFCVFFSSKGLGDPVTSTTGPCGTKTWLVNGEVNGGLVVSF